MYWDISLHIDNGRDPGPLANPAHYFILFGLYGDLRRGLPRLVHAQQDEARAAPAIELRRDWYAPGRRRADAACGSFALIGFPLDDVWHRLFGQDVTLWGPTHLMLIGGAAHDADRAAVVLMAEGSRARRADPARRRRPSSAARASSLATRRAALMRRPARSACRPSRASSTSASRSSASSSSPG